MLHRATKSAGKEGAGLSGAMHSWTRERLEFGALRSRSRRNDWRFVKRLINAESLTDQARIIEAGSLMTEGNPETTHSETLGFFQSVLFPTQRKNLAKMLTTHLFGMPKSRSIIRRLGLPCKGRRGPARPTRLQISFAITSLLGSTYLSRLAEMQR
jgi:hypothetical protein